MACVECELYVSKAVIKKLYEVVIPVPEPAGEAYTTEVWPTKPHAGSGRGYRARSATI